MVNADPRLVVNAAVSLSLKPPDREESEPDAQQRVRTSGNRRNNSVPPSSEANTLIDLTGNRCPSVCAVILTSTPQSVPQVLRLCGPLVSPPLTQISSICLYFVSICLQRVWRHFKVTGDELESFCASPPDLRARSVNIENTSNLDSSSPSS